METPGDPPEKIGHTLGNTLWVILGKVRGVLMKPWSKSGILRETVGEILGKILGEILAEILGEFLRETLGKS